MNDPIQIGGVTPLTTIDFPGRLSCVVFCQGCPWRCRYCHNTHLQPFNVRPEKKDWSWDRLLSFLDRRTAFLDAVVFSGGEPTFQEDLPRAMKIVRELGFEIGLHTAGPDPDLLSACLSLVDWVGMDIKAPFDDRYDVVVGRANAGRKAQTSLEILIASGVEYELRTTVHPALLSKRDLDDIRTSLCQLGANENRIQEFRAEGCRDEELCEFVANG